MRISVVVALAASAAAWVAVGCSKDSGSAAPPSSTSSASAARDAGTAAASSASASASAPAPSGDAAPSVAGGVAGAIACGKNNCKVGKEKCCPTDGSCEGKDVTPMDAYCQNGPAYQCDGREDCPAGQLCCQTFTSSDGNDDNFGSGCAKSCDLAEACLPGGCRPGFRCRPSKTPNVLGTCVVAAPQAKCGDKTCSGATPVCLWDQTTKTTTCGDDHKRHPSQTGADLRCGSKADCGGEDCCRAPTGQTYCYGDCVNTQYVCAAPADCEPDYGGVKLKGCKPVDGGPPWMKICDYGP